MTLGSSLFGLTPGSDDEAKMKVAAVFYDKLVLPISSRSVTGVVRIFSDEGVPTKAFEELWVSYDAYVPASEKGQFDEALRIDREILPARGGKYRHGFKGATDEAIMKTLKLSRKRLRAIENEDRYSYLREYNGVTASAFGGAAIHRRLRQYVPCALVAFYRIEQLAALTVDATDRADDAQSMYEAVEMFVPSVRDLPWAAVADLRSHRKVRNFRQWLAGSASPGGAAGRTQAIDALWAAIDELGLSTRMEVIKGIVGAAPFPLPVNPIGLAMSGRDIVHSWRFTRSRGWLTFLHSAHKATKRGPAT
ncbi:hypothetical protein ACFQO7_31295 [Catellatospora aurea]|uniref:Uncharacterized protein n=1 Tax=Catellatospora aurea TaxID=1337874 RepID=A0ABW2H506_9ACTN